MEFFIVHGGVVEDPVLLGYDVELFITQPFKKVVLWKRRKQFSH
jgi:hypothetical protein